MLLDGLQPLSSALLDAPISADEFETERERVASKQPRWRSVLQKAELRELAAACPGAKELIGVRKTCVAAQQGRRGPRMRVARCAAPNVSRPWLSPAPGRAQQPRQAPALTHRATFQHAGLLFGGVDDGSRSPGWLCGTAVGCIQRFSFRPCIVPRLIPIPRPQDQRHGSMHGRGDADATPGAKPETAPGCRCGLCSPPVLVAVRCTGARRDALGCGADRGL